MTKTLILILVLLILALGYLLFFWQRQNPSRDLDTEIKIRDKQYRVELAESAEEKALGLSGRESLDSDKGMLFLFPNGAKPAFWMKGMNFPIDIIWIYEEKIVGFVENALPMKETGLKLYKPEQKVDMVLELQAGQVKEGAFQIGDSVVLN